MLNPYAEVNWGSCEEVVSVSHQHLSHSMTGSLTPQAIHDKLYATGVRHFAISRYRPSIPCWPFDYEHNQYVYVANPFDSTMPIEELKQEYAFTVQTQPDVIGAPNAEHIDPLIYLNNVSKRWNSIHINAIGSLLESGTVPDPDAGYKNAGLLIGYTEAIDNMLENLLYPEGGGVIINHMNFTDNHKHFVYDVVRFVMDCLDYDPRVLGTDIMEGGNQGNVAVNRERIDRILLTGRRCWIFCQDDWLTAAKLIGRGRNVLLIPPGLSRTEKERACLKAYRDGSFYSRFGNSPLRLGSVSYSGGVYSISAPNADGIRIIVDGEATEYSGSTASQSIPVDAVYVRAEAWIDKDEDPDWIYRETDIYKDILFTNPIMINPVTYPYDPAYDKTTPDPDPDPDPDTTKRRWLLWS